MTGKSMTDGVSERRRPPPESKLADMSNTGGRAPSRTRGKITINVPCRRAKGILAWHLSILSAYLRYVDNHKRLWLLSREKGREFESPGPLRQFKEFMAEDLSGMEGMELALLVTGFEGNGSPLMCERCQVAHTCRGGRQARRRLDQRIAEAGKRGNIR